MGRKKIPIDMHKVDNLLKAGCDGTSIASSMGIHFNTLDLRIKELYKMDFCEYKAQKRAEGDDLIRAKQFGEAMKGDRGMLIWLGKNRLGQKDRSDVTTDGDKIEAIRVYLPDNGRD